MYSSKRKNRALELRREGKSYNEIYEELKVPKSTLSGWLKPHKWSQNIRDNLAKEVQKKHAIRLKKLNKVRGERLQKVYNEARSEAREEYDKLKYHPLFIAAMMIYWGEGDKATKHIVRVGNTDPEMMRLFTLFLTDICQLSLEDLGGHLLYYKDIDEKKCKQYWSNKTKLPLKNFYKSTLLPSRHKKRRSPHGVFNVSYCSTYLKVKFLEWLKLISKDIVSKDYYKYADMV